MIAGVVKIIFLIPNLVRDLRQETVLEFWNIDARQHARTDGNEHTLLVPDGIRVSVDVHHIAIQIQSAVPLISAIQDLAAALQAMLLDHMMSAVRQAQQGRL